MITAGKVTREVLAILAQDDVGHLTAELKRRFDYVLVDSAPILPVTDSLLISQHVDGVLFAIRRDVSRVAKVAAAAQRRHERKAYAPAD